MTYRGHVENGAVVLDESAVLPEGAVVEVAVVDAALFGGSDGESRARGLAKFAGKVNGLPADAARNLEHYLYGHPKQ